MESRKFCKVHPSWAIGTNGDIDKITSYILKKHDQSEENFCSESGEDIACVELHSEGETAKPCELIIKCLQTHSMKMSDISILCEAKTIEIYDDIGSYVSTCRGSYVNMVEGLPMYYTECSGQQPSSTSLLRCLSLPRRTSMKVVALEITLVPAILKTPSSGLGTSFDINKVKTMLQDMQEDAPLSDKARQCLETIEQYQKNQGSAFFNPRKGMDGTTFNLPQNQNMSLSVMSGLMSTFANMSKLNTASSSARTESSIKDCLPSQQAGMYNMLGNLCGQVSDMEEKEKRDEKVTSPEEVCQHCGNKFNMERLEQTLLKKMREMEERTMKNMECQFQKLEKRIDMKLDKLLHVINHQQDNEMGSELLSEEKKSFFYSASQRPENEHLELD